jgi:hypothetical protein
MNDQERFTMAIRTQGYKEPVDDSELKAMIDQGVMNSVGDFLNSSDLARERQKATYEYGMMPIAHLAPQGVSQIVSSDTVEAIEGYSAILAELMFNNNKLARFIPSGTKPTDYSNAKMASELVNYTIFKQNPGWEILNTWVKSSLLWKNSIVRWDFIEDYEYTFEEYESISQENLDILLSDSDTEIIGTLNYDQELATDEEGNAVYNTVYKDVRLKKQHDKTRIKIENVHPEAFRISRGAKSLDDADFVGIQIEMTRSEIRKFYPDIAENIEWDDIGDGSTYMSARYTEEQAARKRLAGEEYWQGGNLSGIYETEANRQVNVIECWLRVDRDGDGIAELKHFIVAGGTVLLEEDCDYVPLATLCPFEIPHEFYGLSVADMIRPSTLATTAIMRGFVENVYLTNYAPKLADPNVVDFSALQNMKPKQIVATNGNPNGAVASMTPDTISTGTVPLLEMLQLHKEQATGLSKAAQGLNDTLYVSGNSEEKMQKAMSAAQVRIQFMARRYAETGFKRLVEGVYKTLRSKLRGRETKFFDQNDMYKSIDPGMLPDNMLMYVDIDVGENSNSNIIKKMTMVGQQLIPALQQGGAGAVVAPDAAIKLASKTLEAMDLDPLDFLVDYTSPEFLEQAVKAREAEQQSGDLAKQLQDKLQQLDAAQREATIALTNVQSRNAMQDNTKQLMVALDKSYQEWAKLNMDAAEKGVEIEPHPGGEALLVIAKKIIEADNDKATAQEADPMAQQQPQQPMM